MKYIATLLFATLIAGCTTLKDASDARGTGKSQVYEAEYDVVWDAVVAVITESKLDLVSKDKEDGKILAQKGMSAFSYGENVAVFVDAISESSSKVEVVSKRALQTNIVAKNWSNHILTGVEEKIKKQ
jgi:hypothetical protein